MNEKEPLPQPQGRRAFLAKSTAIVIGGAVTVAPIATGVVVFLDPLRRKAGGTADFIHVANFSALPESGAPVKFPVVTSRVDAWTKSPATPVGAIYLRRTGPKSVQALNVVCPHAGCFVEFMADRGSYLCPCHNSTFAVDGKINDPRSPSPRALDELAAEIRNDSEVWVKFENFRAGIHEKVPLA